MICQKHAKIQLCKVAKFYSEMYEGVEKFAPPHTFSVKIRDFAELYLLRVLTYHSQISRTSKFLVDLSSSGDEFSLTGLCQMAEITLDWPISGVTIIIRHLTVLIGRKIGQIELVIHIARFAIFIYLFGQNINTQNSKQNFDVLLCLNFQKLLQVFIHCDPFYNGKDSSLVKLLVLLY